MIPVFDNTLKKYKISYLLIKLTTISINCFLFEFNFLDSMVTKTIKNISMYPRSGSRSSKNLTFLKYYNALEWESSITLRLNAVKNIDYIKKGSNKSCTKLNFLQKIHRMHISTYLRSGAGGLQRFTIFEIL